MNRHPHCFTTFTSSTPTSPAPTFIFPPASTSISIILPHPSTHPQHPLYSNFPWLSCMPMSGDWELSATISHHHASSTPPPPLLSLHNPLTPLYSPTASIVFKLSLVELHADVRWLEIECDHLTSSIPEDLWHVVAGVIPSSLRVNPTHLTFIVTEGSRH